MSQESIDIMAEVRGREAAEAAETKMVRGADDAANEYDGECPKFTQGCCHITAATHTAVSALPHTTEAAKNGELGIYIG